MSDDAILKDMLYRLNELEQLMDQLSSILNDDVIARLQFLVDEIRSDLRTLEARDQ